MAPPPREPLARHQDFFPGPYLAALRRVVDRRCGATAAACYECRVAGARKAQLDPTEPENWQCQFEKCSYQAEALPRAIADIVDLFVALQTRWTFSQRPFGFGTTTLRAGIPGDEIEREARSRELWPLCEFEREIFDACVHVIREQDYDRYQHALDSLNTK